MSNTLHILAGINLALFLTLASNRVESPDWRLALTLLQGAALTIVFRLSRGRL